MDRIRFFQKNTLWWRYLAVGGIAFLCLWNANSLLTGKIGTMFIKREISEEYFRYREFINEQEEYFRVLAVPVPSKWMTYTNKHPKASLVDLVRGPWDQFSLPKMSGHPQKDERKWLSPLEQNFSDRLLDVSSIRYIVIPRDDPQNADDFFKDFGKRDAFVQIVDTLPYLERVDIGTKDLLVYENSGSRPHIYITSEEERLDRDIPYETPIFSSLSPSQYRIELPSEISLEKKESFFYMHFSEKYHPDWKIRIGAFSWWDALWEQSYFLDDSFHRENEAGLNSFALPYTLLDTPYSSEITIFFRPQAYLYRGLLISGFVFALCLGYMLLWIFRTVSKKRKNTSS